MSKDNKWVIKAGSSLVSGNDKGINNDFIARLSSQVNFLKKNNQDVIIISSGAVAKGMSELGFKERPESLATLQACAAVGQRGIAEIYQQHLQVFGYNTAQVLITHDDIANRTRYLNAKNTLESLLEMGIIPIVNENDCVATEEISFGDNDLLTAVTYGSPIGPTAKAHSGTANDLNITAESGDVTIANAASGELVYFRLSRDVSDDTQTGDARLIGIKLFFTTDKANDE